MSVTVPSTPYLYEIRMSSSNTRPRQETRVPIRALDVGCRTGESTHFLHRLLRDSFAPLGDEHLDVHIIGMDTSVKDLHEASGKYPTFEFLYYDFFSYSHLDIQPRSVHVLQISASQLKENVEDRVRHVHHVLRRNGCLHLYGTFPKSFPWKQYGLKCLYYFPYGQDIDYVVLQQTYSMGFLEGIPRFLTAEGSHRTSSSE